MCNFQQKTNKKTKAEKLMNRVKVIMGAFAILYGIYTAYIRATNPSKFGKLQAMKETWGEKTGTIIHTIFYTIIPLGFGIVMIAFGFLN